MNLKGIVWTAVILFIIVGGIVIGAKHKSKSGSTNIAATSTAQSGTPEGGEVSIPVHSDFPAASGPVTAVFFDAGAHGWHAVQQGGGTFIQYDGTTGLKYKTTAVKNSAGGFTATVPDDICGLLILPEGAPTPASKVIEVTLTGPDGKTVPGTAPMKFDLKCDRYTLKATIKASNDPVLPDGVSASTVTANFSVTGPAKFANGKRIPHSQAPIILTTPLGLMDVHFNTSLGNLNPNPANVRTDLGGNASVVITSADAGIAKVMAQASGVGDAQINIHFAPKITAVKQDFVPPTSPTNYAIKTIPANPKDLTIAWQFLPAAGVSCGHMTGAASGLGLANNGFYHGPEKNYPDGCPEDWEHASQVKVTVTDKDGQTDTKTFGARSFEGQGFVNLP